MDANAAPEAATPSSKKPARIGKDELNLATLPMSVLTHQQPTDTERDQKHYRRVFSYTVYDDQIERWVPAKVTLESNPRLGLPTPADEALFLALFNLALESEHLAHERFEFVPNQLFKLMGLDPNRRAYNLLEKKIERLTAVKVTCEYSWFDVDAHQYQTKYIFGVLADAKLHRPKQARGRKPAKKQPKSFVVFDPEIYRQLTSGTLKPIDLGLYFSLKRPISRRMYRSLDRFFYRRSEYSSDLRNFAHGNLGMSADYDNGEIKSKLQPAIDDLVLRNFIQPADRSQRYTKVKPGIWRINFEKTAKRRAKRPQPESKLDPLAQQLLDRGITKSVALKLVADHPAKLIATQIEVFDWHANQHHKKSPGWLRKAIEDDYGLPDDFTTKAQREAKTQSTHQQRAAERRQKEEETTRLAAERDEYVALGRQLDSLPEARRTDILQAVLAAKPAYRQLRPDSYAVHRACCKELKRRRQPTAT